MFVCKSLHSLTYREVLRSRGEEAVVEGGEGEVGDKLGVRVQERHVRLMNRLSNIGIGIISIKSIQCHLVLSPLRLQRQNGQV